MSARSAFRAGARLAAAALAALLVSAALAGCQDIFNSIFDTGAPTGVDASDGDYANEIQVSWSAPNLSSDKWKGYTVDYYLVSWDGPESGTDNTSGTSYSIDVDPENRAKEYTVTVTSYLSPETGGSTYGGSGDDTGFALSTKNLVWYDGGRDYAVADGEQWYVTMLQKGFAYDFDFGSGTGIVEFYPYKSLDPVHSRTDPAPIQSWECDEDGDSHKFFVRVEPSGSSFAARYDPYP